MQSRILAFLLISVISLCAQSKEKTIGQKIDNKIEATQETIDQEWQELTTEIAKLKSELKNTSGQAKADMTLQIQALEKDQEKLSHKLKELRKSTGKAWGELSKGFSAAFSEIKQSVEKAKSSFNKAEEKQVK
jgi:uncharacterized protein YukE